MTDLIFAPLRQLRKCLLLLACLLPVVPVATALAQDARPFTDAELDQMLAPIALYPDSLLSQVLMACTYPADVKSAADWVKAHPDAKGDAAVTQVKDEPWEPAVQSLVAFPQVLAMLQGQPDQVQKLGDAFLADPGRVMDRVQVLRRKAQESGNLASSPQQTVTNTTENSKQVIVIEPAKPETVYVPVYQPSVVYGTWPYPSYPPVYYPPPPAYYPGATFAAGVVWGAAVVGISNSLWGGFGWGRNDVDINVNRYNNINVNRPITNNNSNFNFNPERRGSVPYRDNASRQRYDKPRAGADQRQNFRGHDAQVDAQRQHAADTLKQRGADPAAGRERLQGADRDRANAAVRDSSARQSHAGQQAGNRTHTADRQRSGSALSGAHDAAGSRADAERGRASRAAQHSGAGHARPAGGGHARPAGGGGHPPAGAGGGVRGQWLAGGTP